MSMNEVKIVPFTNRFTYHEIPQTNPLRWVVLYREEDTYTEQSGEFKCKDFFNEFVSKYNGHATSIYGFNAGEMKVNEGELYVLLKNITDFQSYQANIGSINSLAAQHAMPPVTLEATGKPGELVAALPSEYFMSTWLISLLTYLMRVANVPVVVEDPTWQTHPTKGVDNPFREQYTEVLTRGFQVPEVGATTFYWVGNRYPYPATPNVGTVHNNGCYNWLYTLNVLEAI